MQYNEFLQGSVHAGRRTLGELQSGSGEGKTAGELLPTFTESQLTAGLHRTAGSLRDAQGTLVSYVFANPGLRDTKFGFVYLDKAQYLRNPSSANHIIVDMLGKSHVLWVTGTPLYAGPRDILGPLEIG